MKNNVYKLVLVLFSLLTIFEVIVYLISSSSFVGLLYLLINFVILFMLFLVSTSVKKTNVRKRILFNIIIVAFGFMASFYVSSKTIVFGYTEISENYFSKILISSKILKSIEAQQNRTRTVSPAAIPSKANYRVKSKKHL